MCPLRSTLPPLHSRPRPAGDLWLWVPALFLISRLIGTLTLYLLCTPGGVRVAEHPWKFIEVAWLSEAGSFLVISALLGLAVTTPSVTARRTRFWMVLLALVTHAALAEVDAHLRRWMGLRLNLPFLRHFMHGAVEPGFWRMLGRYLAQDAPAVSISFGLVTAPLLAALSLRQRCQRSAPRRWYLVLAVLGGMALAVSPVKGIALRKWKLVAPAPYSVAMDVGRELWGRSEAPEPEALTGLRGLTGGVSANDTYPLWRPDSREKTSLAQFRLRPASSKPDVFLFAIESLRGWVVDWRSPDVAARVPHLAALFRERGVGFVRAHSNGYPSGEGNMHLHLGVWSHPARAVASEHVAMQFRSLPEILRMAGYASLWMTGSDPSFDNLQHFVGRWFDRWEYRDGGDVALARRAIEAYDELGSDRPRFLSLYTASTHPRYVLPPSEGPHPEDSDEAYMRALAYADRAVGMVVDHVRRAGAMDRTLFVITGDHAQPNAWHLEHDEEIGLPNAGRTWTGMMVAGPGLQGGTIRDDAVSHVDVPPTILGRLGITVSNHFLGRDLFGDEPQRPAVAVLREGASLIRGDTMIVGDLAGETVRKFQYDQGPLAQPETYQHGRALPVEAQDHDEFARVRAAVRAYGWLLDHDRMMRR